MRAFLTAVLALVAALAATWTIRQLWVEPVEVPVDLERLERAVRPGNRSGPELTALGTFAPAPWTERPTLLVEAEAEGTVADVAALRAQIETIVKNEIATGVAVGVVEHGKIAWVDGFGVLEPTSKRPMTGDTMFRVGSFSKTVVGLAVAALSEDGAFSMADPVRTLAPEIEVNNPWEETHPVRVSHLLEHSAGFDEMHFNEVDADGAQLHWSPREILDFNPRSRDVRWRPGTRYSYSHPGFTFAAHLLETSSGRPWEQVIRERIFEPLGMTRATFQYGPDVAAELAPAFRRNSLEPINVRPVLHRPGRGLYASARDMTRFMATFATGGVLEGKQVIPSGWIERVEHGDTLPYGDMARSYGLGLWSGFTDRVRVRGHGGWAPGHHSIFRYLPSVASGYVVMTNEPLQTWAAGKIAYTIQAYLRRGAPRETQVPRVRLPPESLDEHVGSYRRNGPTISFASAFVAMPICQLSRRNDRLHWSGARECEGDDLVPTSPQTFRRMTDVRPSMWVGQSPDGVDTVWDAHTFGYYEKVPSWWGTVRALMHIMFAFGIGGGLLWPAAWLPTWIFKRRRPPVLLLRLAPSLGAWAVVVMALTLFNTPAHALGTVSFPSLAVFCTSWLIPICGAIGLPLAIWRILRPGRDLDGQELLAGIYGCVISTGVLAVAIRLAMFGLIGVQTWSW